MSLPVSTLAPEAFPDIPAVAGVRFATAAAGVKYRGRDDVMLAVMEDAAVAGVFTRSATRSAPVLDCQAKLSAARGPAAFLVNSGNANAFTGKAGEGSVKALCSAVAAATSVPEGRIYTASTGVIGERLPHGKIEACLGGLSDGLSADGIEAAAEAIRTTDTFAKGAFQTIEVGGTPVTIAGIAKGSGMIAPDMATMLVYIFTDASHDGAALQDLLGTLTDGTFNAITVDSDTSTSDSLLLAATGAAGVDATGDAGFATALEGVMRDLAHQVVRDGEGATKFVEITCTEAATEADAKKAALAIANSPLVKTAIAGEDPNWGRIVMAIGKSGAAADRDALSIRFGDTLVAEEGWVAASYREEDGAAYMKQEEIQISVSLGVGTASATVWTCDLTHQYITINADYRS
ncbi:MAG: bifunctional glutamate N-acetyltransferase/amino-acid acetyltransferase ArgJ [Rhodobacteraceae bacterium]|nr:bifunctional glutamate N-acetyltransferase/amino-acid acetyltransferase ArgJ [Paracoccaceae bacterium]